MNSNYFCVRNLRKKLVQRSTNPYYKGKFALVTDVNELAQFQSVTETMVRAAQSMPDAFFIHFKIDTEDPGEAVKVVPSILQSFNRTRTLRRACVSGIRLCNLLNTRVGWYYVSDMVVSCAFDAVSICAGLADYSSLGSQILTSISIPKMILKRGSNGIARFAEQRIERFWSRSKLARHSLHISYEIYGNSHIVLCFEPTTISHIALLNYILDAFRDSDNLVVEVGRNSRLIVSKEPLWVREDYLCFAGNKIGVNYRYRHAAAFGRFHRNPDYLLY